MNRSSAAWFLGSLLGLGFGLFMSGTAKALSEEDVAADTPIPLVAVLWQNTNFGGIKREVIADTVNLKDQRFNDGISSVGVHPGPDYLSWKSAHGGREPTVTLFSNAGGSGKSVVLRTGIYPDLKSLKMNDNISSVYFTDSQSLAVAPTGTAASFNSIPIVVELFVSSYRMWLVESTKSLSDDYGSMWKDSVYSARMIHRTLGVNPGAFQVEFCAGDFFDSCEVQPAKATNGIDQYNLPKQSFNGSVKAWLSSIRIEPTMQ